jgi:hypothetical protein
MVDENEELLARLARIQQLTAELIRAQNSAQEQRELARKIEREIAEARLALRPVPDRDE